MSVNVKLILIEILSDLSEKQFERFKWRLVNGVDDKKISYYNLEFANREKTIDKMLSHFGSSDALEKVREILEAVPRKDLADKLMKKVKDTLREILDELSEENFSKFKSCLVNGDDDKKISRPSLEGANREKTIEMVDHFRSFDALETAEKILEDMKVAGKLMKKVPGCKTSSAQEKGGAQGDHGEEVQELNVKQCMVAGVCIFGGMAAAAATLPVDIVILIGLGAGGFGYVWKKYIDM